ncbi:hypothetical protein PHYPSEUDO_007991 [Phytophthora pseudosyringae]|uniref:EGF-like domain-containing protein n=1 Tax=Phytophthora pseudosyringae TaxID=221518 RepID=A0A8T1VIG1_9STRA|nr:hypothetical protein PHYPSEUDO_007991 [Phytophthora pseudosyringae]
MRLLSLLLCAVSCAQLGDAAITSASVTPTSLDAGVIGTIDVAFTTSTTIPVGGTIVITFPSTFYVDSASALTNALGFDDTGSTVVATPATGVVTITIAAADAAAGTISFTLDSISNPGMGTSSSYSIRTKSVGGSTLESATVPGSTFATGTIGTTAAVTAASLLAGRTTTYTITFTTGVTLRIGSVIALQFPSLPDSKIVFTSATVSSLVGIDAASTVVQVASPYLRLTVAGQDIAAGTTVAIAYSNIINPATQTSGDFGVHTRHPTGAIFQENQAVPELAYTSTTLPSATVTPVSNWAGIVTDYNVVFANLAYVPSGSRVDITFPSRFDISSATMSHSSNLPTVNTLFSVVSATTARVTLGNTAALPGIGRRFTLVDIVNPGSSCDQFIVEYCTTVWESYTVTISDSGGRLFEDLTTVAGTPIVKKPLTYGRVRPLLKTPNTMTVATVALDTVAAIPDGGYIEAVLPDDYSVAAGAITPSDLVNIPSASTVVTSTASSVMLLIAGTNIPAATGISFTVDKITTPSNFAVGTFTVRTRDAGGNTIEESSTIGGEGCTYVNDCSGHGTCTLLSKVCVCDTGWGAPTDVADYKSPDCSTRVCPSNYAWGSIPTSTTTGHDVLVECSGVGVCDRSAGTCSCFPGFEGSACERMGCPNECSDRGMCMSMREMAAAKNALPISPPTTYGGAPLSSTWDADRIFGCVCDSGWAVGTASGELQATEYFNADCSKRHCPIGNDPDTTVDETNCAGKTVPGGTAVGAAGNKCLVECANRGVCNYKTGICTCFQGYAGYACQTRDGLAK